MSAFLLLLICPLLGWITLRLRWMPDNTVDVINAWLLRVALPAVILQQIPKLQLDTRLLLPALGPVVLMLSTIALMNLLARRMHWDRGTLGAMILCCSFGNTSFIGFPLLIAVGGMAALGPGVIADQVTFICVTTVGLSIAAYFGGDRVSAPQLAMRVLRFTPFQALIAAGLMKLLGLGWPAELEGVLARLAETLSPLALFSLGYQLHFGSIRRHLKLLCIGLGWKMIALPALMWGGALLMGVHGLPITVGILQVGMAPMITSGIFARQYNLNPDAVTALISAGSALSFLTIPIWYLLIGV